MKKLLRILVLGLGLILLNSCETTHDIWFGMNYEKFMERSNYKYYAEACPPNKLEQPGCGFGGSNSSQNEADGNAMDVCSESFPNCVVIKQGSSWVNYNEQTNNVKMASMIAKSKNTCKSLGFTEGTEKFTDCALKLYTQEIELAAKNNQQVQSMSGGVVTIYDPVRDNQRMIRQGQRMLSGACTLGIDC